MNDKRRRLLMAQALMGDGSGGTCPECGSSNTRLIEEGSCEICGEMTEECYCYNCQSSYTIYYCDNPDCGGEEPDWECPTCGCTNYSTEYCTECGEYSVIYCGECGESFCTYCGWDSLEHRCDDCGEVMYWDRNEQRWVCPECE